METYKHDESIVFTIVFADSDGSPVTLTSVNWWLYDEVNTLLSSGPLDPSGSEVDLTLDASLHQVPAGQGKDGRCLIVQLNVDDGRALYQEVPYLLTRLQPVIIGSNSFLSFVHALRLIPEFPQFVALSAATAEKQKDALAAAYRNIGNLELLAGALRTPTGEVVTDSDGNTLLTTRSLTAELLASLEPKILQDFQYAQLAEAEYVLGGDGNEDLRSKGVMSYTVGEVKQFFRTRKPVEWSASKHALRYIGKYLQYQRRVYRA